MTCRTSLFTVIRILLLIGPVSFCHAEGEGGIASGERDHSVRTATKEMLPSICFNLENAVAASFISDAEASYSAGIGRSGVSLLNYIALGPEASPYLHQVVEQYDTPNWAELPAGVAVPTHGGTSVCVSSRPDFESGLVFPADGDTTRVYNLVPNRIYWYRVDDAWGEPMSAGVFKTIGRVRMIKTRNIFNARDLGGWPCEWGRLAYGKLIRSAKLDRLASYDDAPLDIDVFTRILGVDAQLDLREETAPLRPLGTDVSFYKQGIEHYMYQMTNTVWSSSASQLYSGDYYAHLRSGLEFILKHLQLGHTVLFNCSMGADRTGTLAFLIEALCGVSEPDLVIEWELSSLTGKCYRKYIDQEELDYYYRNGDAVVKSNAELRSVFWYLYNNYGGREGASIRQQVTAWLSNKVFSEHSDHGASFYDQLRRALIVPETKSPTLICGYAGVPYGPYYSLVGDSSQVCNYQLGRRVDAVDGTIVNKGDCATTGFVDCSGYRFILAENVCDDVAAFFDKEHHFLCGIRESASVDEQDTPVRIGSYREYAIPADAAYAMFNITMDKGLTAVLSAESLLSATAGLDGSPEWPAFASVNPQSGTDVWYSLDGCRMSESQPHAKGLYLHKGRKVMIR